MKTFQIDSFDGLEWWGVGRYLTIDAAAAWGLFLSECSNAGVDPLPDPKTYRVYEVKA